MLKKTLISILATNACNQPQSGIFGRDRFLSAIELIKQHTQVINVDSGIDYRLRFLDKAETYHSPLDQNATEMLRNNFEHIAPDPDDRQIIQVRVRIERLTGGY